MKKLIILSAIFLFSGITFGQSLQKGGVVAIHEWTLKLKADITMNQFLDHWEETIVPEMEKFVPLLEELSKFGEFIWSPSDWVIL